MTDSTPDDELAAQRPNNLEDGNLVMSQAHEVTFCDGKYRLASFEPRWETAKCPAHGEMDEVELQATRDGDVWVLEEESSFWLCYECLGALMEAESNFQDDPDPVEFLGEFVGQNWDMCEQYMVPVTDADAGGDPT